MPEVTLTFPPPGLYNGEPYPPAGEVVDVDEDTARALVKFRMGELVETAAVDGPTADASEPVAPENAAVEGASETRG